MKKQIILNNILTLFIMLFNNILALPLILLNIRKKKESILIISLFFAVLGFYFRPYIEEYDIARYYSMFSDIKLREESFLYQKDLYAEYMIKFLLNTNLPKYFLGFTSAFITYYFFFKSLKIILEKSNKFYYLKYYIFYYISIPIIGYTGIRFFPAAPIFIYSLILKYIKNNKKYIFYMFISCFFHSSMFLLVVLFYFNEHILKRMKLKVYKGILIISIFLGILLNTEILLIIIKKINSIGYIYVSEGYLYGKWGIDYLKEFKGISFYKNLFLFIFERSIIILFFLLIETNKKSIKKYLFLLGSFCLFVMKFATIFERYFKIFFFLSLLISFFEYKKGNKKIEFYFFIVLLYNFCNLFLNIKYDGLSIFYSYNNVFKLSIFNIIIETFKNYF